MTDKVRLLFFTQALDCETCGITGQILDEVAPLGEKIELVRANYAIDRELAQKFNIKRIPAIAVLRLDESTDTEGNPQVTETDYGVRFYGVPSGYSSAAGSRQSPR